MSAHIPPGTILGGTYRIVRLVGRGGMGDVYEATHARLAGRYALKVLGASGVDSEDLVRRFRREAEVTSGLRHPNIVHVVDFNTTADRRPYLVMEFLEGTELTAEIRRCGAMPVARALDLVGQIASALAAAHAQQIVHRDLKPQNLFLVPVPGEDREIVKVVDFGISKVREATTQLTQDTAIMGTPQYMAPEQAQGRLAEIDGRTDQFALGAITFELLTGQPAFRGGTIPSLLYQVVHEQPASLRALNPGLPPAMEAVVLRALAKRREHRYPGVREFHRDLVLAAQAAPAEPVAPAPDVPRWIEQPQIAITTFRTSSGQVQAPPPRPPGRGRVFAGVAVAVLAVAVGLGYARRGEPGRAPAAAVEPTPPARVTVDVVAAPPGLQVRLDGAPVHPPLALLRGPERHRLELFAPGYQPLSLEVDGQQPRSIDLRGMQPLPPVAAPAPAPSAPARRVTRRPNPRPRPTAEAHPPRWEPPAAEPPPPPAGKRARPITDF